MTNHIQQIQDQYGELLKLLPKLENSLADWHKAIKLSQQLSLFYTSPEWLDLYDNANHIKLDTQGNYSILSQDAIWNVLTEQRELTEQMSKIIALLDDFPKE
ncbi:DUF4298 domain-containing protein [Actinobacillus arthritidis]|uniref:DUF4298 domain-containing protein n=1 Tax=Actinobacillus arthritidis TaxID=157339 RepID=UPI002441E0CA|nr:DUF4298 domain-containing protein [Actinobacillus arthritidis]WGE90048.1 DUF4298 domain-containing protein [Actinobacillus arthritidis]